MAMINLSENSWYASGERYIEYSIKNVVVYSTDILFPWYREHNKLHTSIIR